MFKKIALIIVVGFSGLLNAGEGSSSSAVALQDEFKVLAKQYTRGFPVFDIPGLDRLYLTSESLQHVFGIQTKKESKGVYLSGFHHDEMLKEKRKMFYASSRTAEHGIQERLIAVEKTHLPVFKTFFSGSLSKQQVVSLWNNSLKNIQKTEPQKDGKLLIEGTTSQGIHIRTVVNKNTGEVITFFPVTEKPEEEIRAEEKKEQDLFKKFFWHRPDAPMRSPINQEEITELLRLYFAKIPFNMVVAKVDTVRPEDREEIFAACGYMAPPHFVNVFIRKSDFKKLSIKYPGRIVFQTAFKTLHFTRESLTDIFSEKNDANFPSYLTRKEIMNLAIEALKNLESTPSKIEAAYDILYLPDKRDNLWCIRAGTNGTGNNDAFTFYIKIDESTGIIKNFYPLAY